MEIILIVSGLVVVVALAAFAILRDLTERDRARHQKVTPLLGVVLPKKEDEDA